MSFATSLWSEFGGLAISDIPPDVGTAARHCLLDWLGCALAGTAQPAAEMVRAAVAAGTGGSTMLGTDAPVDSRTAALVNGTAGHALDFDDTNRIGGLHMTAPVAPAVLAIAEAESRSGAELLEALIVGCEIVCRYGAAIPLSHYERGWHSTSMLGPIGAAAAVSRLWRFDSNTFAVASGIAASHSGGVQANFGTMTKPLHAGLAAEAGVMAAMLAARGFSASPTAFEGFRGLVQASSDGPASFEYAGPAWALPETMFKFHASCHGSHPTIECARRVAASGIAPDAIERVELLVHPTVYDVCRVVDPSDDLETKFCLPLVFASGCAGLDTTDPATFRRTLLDIPEIDRLRRVVTVECDAQQSPTGTEMRLTTYDHSELTVVCDLTDDESDLEHQGTRITTKFLQLAEPVVGASASEVCDLVWQLDDLASVEELTRLLRFTR